MARKSVFKTPLGRRLAEVRERFGLERDAFAEKLGCVSAGALANYERGDNVPDATVLAAYREVFGISLVWLIAGQGGMFEDDRKAPPSQDVIDPALMEHLYTIAEKVYRDAGQRPPGHRIAHEAGTLYNALVATVRDVRDEAVVDAVLPILIAAMAERLKDAAGEPGSGKRLASGS